jgi:hypothetical protein
MRTATRRILTSLALPFAALDSAQGQARPAHDLGRSLTSSVMVGGVAIEDSRLALGKFSLERGHWALVADITRDATRERWDLDASRGDYTLWGGSLHARRYSRPGGRGFFVEAGGGAGRAALNVTEADGTQERRKATVPLAAWGVGGRISLGRSAGFLELGYRSITPLATRHLHAGDTAPEGSTRDFVTYQSWYFGRGKSTGQPYLGLGLTF